MEKLTKKQHREIITDLMNENHNVKDLRNIQRVAEIFKEDAELRKEGSVLVDGFIRYGICTGSV